MAAPDKKTVMKDLLEMGKAKGQLTTKEILDALGELDFEPEQIEKFYDTLESQGVEIVEDFGDIALDDIEFTQEENGEDEDLESSRADKYFRVNQTCRANNLFHYLCRMFQFKITRCCTDKYRLIDTLIKFIEIQRTIIKGRRQTESIIN